MSIAINIENLSFGYGSHKVLDSINLSINSGEFVALVGPNGAGKSTLLKLILGILKPSTGKINILDESREANHISSSVGYVPQRMNTSGEEFPATVREIILTGVSTATKHHGDELLELFGLQKLQNSLISDLSGGERQKVLIARSLISKPKILILDEPTAAIDVEGQSKFYELLDDLRRKFELTIILVTHDVGSLTSRADKVVFLNKSVECFHSVDDFVSNYVNNNPSETFHIFHHKH